MTRIRRIVAALDTSTPHRGVANLAGELALRLKAALHGLYVEDAGLSQLAEHPCAAMVGVAARPGDEGDLLTRALRIQAEAAERAMIEAANRFSLAFSFRAARGSIAGVIGESCAADDLVVLGMRRDTAAPVLREVSHSLLLLRRGAVSLEPLRLLFDGSPASLRAMELAVELARRDGGKLEIDLLTGQSAEAETWGAELSKILAESGLDCSFVHCPPPFVPRLKPGLEQGGTVVLGQGMETMLPEDVLSLLENTRCSLGIAG